MSSLILVKENIGTLPFFELIEFLDPRHKAISKELKIEILKTRYTNSLISDGLETGILSLSSNGSYSINSKQSIASIKGFIFESFFTNQFNMEHSSCGKNAFNWCTGRKKSITDKYFEQYKAIGTGFITTKNLYTRFYEPHSNADIKFIRKNDYDEWETAIELGTTNAAGIQIKAITCNEQTEIIYPILNKKYRYVLTCLKNRLGVHSHDVCMNLISNMYSNREIDFSTRCDLESRIYSPQQLGISQHEIDDYSQYIDYWYLGKAPGDIDITNAINKEIIGYKYNEVGLLIPI